MEALGVLDQPIVVEGETGDIIFRWQDSTIQRFDEAIHEAQIARWGTNRLPTTMELENLEAVSVPLSYTLRPKMYKYSAVSVATVNGEALGAASLVGKLIMLNGQKVHVAYGVDGIIHPDYRFKGFVTILSLRNGVILKLLIPVKGDYGSVSLCNLASVRSCEKVGMRKLFSYDRLIVPVRNCDYFPNQNPPTDGVTVIRNKTKSANLMAALFGNLDFFPADATEITCAPPFIGTTFFQNGDKQAYVSIWNSSKVSILRDPKTGEELKYYLLFCGGGDHASLCELLRRIISYFNRPPYATGYVFANVTSSYDPLAKALYEVAGIDQLRVMPYGIFFSDRGNRVRFGFDPSIVNPKEEDTSSNSWEGMIGEDQDSADADVHSHVIPERKFCFVDPRDLGILMVPLRSIAEDPSQVAATHELLHRAQAKSKVQTKAKL